MTSRLLSSTVRLYEGLESVTWEGVAFKGQLLFNSDWLEALQLLENHSAIQLRRSGRTLTVEDLQRGTSAGEVVEVRIDPPADDSAYFARDLSALLKIEKFRHSAPPEFYLAADRYYHPNGPPPSHVTQYFKAVEFLDMVFGVADHIDKRATGTWVILLAPEGKTEFPVFYGVADVEFLTDVSSLRTAVFDPPHALVKRGLFRTVLLQLLTSVAVEDRCVVLLKSFSDAAQKFSHNLELFLREFSFETEREKFETQLREYMLKLNNTLNDIHAKLIAIPAAVVLVGGQMKEVDSSAALLSNSVLLAGAVVFAVLMFMLTLNQRHSLRAIRLEYENRKVRLQAELPKLFPEFAAGFTALEKRYDHQNRLLKWINRLVILGLVFSVLIFVMYLLAPRKPKEEPRQERLIAVTFGGPRNHTPLDRVTQMDEPSSLLRRLRVQSYSKAER